MNIACLFSGGKDSNYALFLASKKHKVKCLIAIKSKNKESYMFHTINNNQIKKQAQALQIPLITHSTHGKKELELKDLEKAIKKVKEKYNIKGIVSGAIASTYQKSRVDDICKKLNLKSIAPMWHMDQEKYLKQLIKNKFKVIITGIAAEGLTKKDLGEKINKEFLNKLKKLNEKYQLNISGEGGEYETFVINSPLFKKELKIKSQKKILESENTGKLEITIQ